MLHQSFVSDLTLGVGTGQSKVPAAPGECVKSAVSRRPRTWGRPSERHQSLMRGWWRPALPWALPGFNWVFSRGVGVGGEMRPQAPFTVHVTCIGKKCSKVSDAAEQSTQPAASTFCFSWSCWYP